MQTDYNGYFSLIRVLKSKKKEAGTNLNFIVSIKIHDWMIPKNVFS